MFLCLLTDWQMHGLPAPTAEGGLTSPYRTPLRPPSPFTATRQYLYKIQTSKWWDYVVMLAALCHACLVFWEPTSFREAWGTRGISHAPADASTPFCTNASTLAETAAGYAAPHGAGLGGRIGKHCAQCACNVAGFPPGGVTVCLLPTMRRQLSIFVMRGPTDGLVETRSADEPAARRASTETRSADEAS